MNCPAPRLGFSLLEMLVVLAVIVILAALIYPAIRYGLEASQRTKCQGNLRQLGMALQGYLQDNDGNLPQMRAMRASTTEDVPVIDTVLGRYISDAHIFQCPADSKGLWQSSGTSYWWYEAVTLKLNGQHNYKNNTLESFFLGTGDPQEIPLIIDKEGFHAAPVKINALYADGHSGPLVAPNPNK